MADYEIILTNDKGLPLADLSRFTSLEATRVANGIGPFAISHPLSFDERLLRPDNMVQIWRQPPNATAYLWRTYFIRRWKFSTQGSQDSVLITGPDVNDLLRRRIVAAYVGNAKAAKTDYADDMMKAFVSESQTTEAILFASYPGSRAWADLSVAGDLSLGPSLTKSFPYSYLLSTSGEGVLSNIAATAKENDGTDLFFDIVPNIVTGSSIDFIFRTYTGQPGQDVSDRVTFEQSAGNMINPELEYDYSAEQNFVYAGGQGEEADREVQYAHDAARWGLSQWNRCEGWVEATNESTDVGVYDAANAALNAGRPIVRFTAQPVDTEGTRFGVDWDFGYRVTAKYRNREFTPVIFTVALSVGDNGETIQARLDFAE